MPSRDKNTTLQRLPIGTQSFEKLRTNGDLYIDKTMYACKMVQDFNVVFLSRPRRFGKSLMVSTLQALFEGKKDLFNGLYAYDKWDWTQTNPVVRIDWTGLPSDTPESMQTGLVNAMRLRAEENNISLISNSPDDCFKELLIKLHTNCGRKVVVLIDEYDKPVTDNLGRSNMDDLIRITHDFYQVMKGADEHIRFAFLTGVSKLAGLSVFSALNNIKDISLNPEFAGICGYTKDELLSHFSEYIDVTAPKMKLSKEELIKEIKYWYDGYTWDGSTSVYNPYAVLNFFSDKVFMNYWFNTATPTLLLEIIKKKENPAILELPISTSLDILNNGYDPNDIDETVLLYQTGYIAIKKITEYGRYILDFPNSEVKHAFFNRLYAYYGSNTIQGVNEIRNRIEDNIRDNNPVLLANALRKLIDIPYQIKADKEANLHALLHVGLYGIGFDVQSEVSTEDGRIDAVWRLPYLTVVTEIKRSNERSADKLLSEAMTQIHDRKYYEKYIGKIILLAVAFGKDSEIKCKMERIDR
jgi:hypothetical protein